MTTAQLNEIAERFAIEGDVKSYTPYGDGHINEYLSHYYDKAQVHTSAHKQFGF